MLCKEKSGFWKNFKAVSIGTAVMKAVAVPIALITAQLLSDVITRAISGDVPAVVKSSILILALMVAAAILQAAGDLVIRKQQSKAENRCRIGFLETLLQNPIDRLFQAKHGELTENLNDDLNEIKKRYTEAYPNMAAGVLSTVGYLLFLLLKSPIAAITLLIISLLQLFPPMIVKKYMQVNYEECRDMEAKITDHVVEAVNGFEMIKLYGLKNWWLAKLDTLYKPYLKIGWKADAVVTAQHSMYEMLDNILKFGTYMLMGFYVMLGYFPLDTAVQAIYLSSGLYGGIKTFFAAIPSIAVSRKAEERLNRWYSADTGNTKAAASNPDGIALKNISYQYEDKSLFNGVNIQFDSVKNYLIAGNNGAGKTTFINLMAGLLLPDCGQVLANPMHLFYIPQTDPDYHFDARTFFQMFDAQYGQAMTTRAKQLGLTEETLKGCAISDLSGGERKKVFLSIGFALQPEFLILDEPSNNLDSHGKQVLWDWIHNRKGIILISHDPEFHTSVDCVMKIENGRVYHEDK